MCRASFAWLLLALGAVAACTPSAKEVSATELVVRVSAEQAVLSQLQTLRLRIAGPEGQQWTLRNEKSFPASALTWPVDLVLVPPSEAQAQRGIEVILEALDASGAVLVQSRTLTSFVLRQARVLSVLLATCGSMPLGQLCPGSADCLGASCQSCLDNACGLTPVTNAEDLPTLNQIDGVDASVDVTTDGGPAITPVGGDEDTGLSQDAGGGALQDAGGGGPQDASSETGSTALEADGAAPDAGPLLTGIALSGSACSTGGIKVCDMHDGQQPLICSNGVWTPNGSCDGASRCQTQLTSPNVGTCQPIVSACVGKAPGDVVCDGTARQSCGLDLLDYVSNACPPHASCQNQSGSVSCACDAPYMDDHMGGCTVPICMQMPCQNRGICSLAPVGRTCDCSQVDYQGDSCETKIDDCQPNPCVHGTCADGVRAHTCDCSAVDYDGQNCETKRDDCQLNPCAHGTCTDGVRARSCSCPPGFSGSSCEINDNECAGTNVCSGVTNGVPYSFACVNYTGDTAGYTCQGQFPDWQAPTFAAGRFSSNGGVVTDNQTGLRWQQAIFNGTWDDAKINCDTSTLAGGGWRFPTLPELQSILDYSSAVLLPSVFDGASERYYWSASRSFDFAATRYMLCIATDGSVDALNADTGYAWAARCVR